MAEPSSSFRVLIADDHPVVRMGMTALINREADMSVVGAATDGHQAVAMFIEQAPDVVMLDLLMPGMDGIQTLAAIRAHDPFARVIMLTTADGDEDIYRCLRAGAKAYLLKDAPTEEVVDCLRTVRAGRTSISPNVAAKLAGRVGTADLTNREREVLTLIAKGRGNRDIGVELEVTEGTVKVHVNNILTKLNVGSRTEAVTLSLKRGIVRLKE